MNGILSVISLILIMVILLSLQLTPGTFSIFYHHALGKYRSKKADDLSLSFILGVELFATALWLSVYFIIYAIFINLPDYRDSIILWILAGIIAAEAIVFFYCYFRRVKSRMKSSTALFLPRRFAGNLITRAHNVKTKKDALALGFFTGVPEMLFTLPLIITGSLILVNSIIPPAAFVVILCVLLATVPLFIIRTAYHSGQNLADIQRFRARLRPAIRVLISLCFLALSLTLISLGLL